LVRLLPVEVYKKQGTTATGKGKYFDKPEKPTHILRPKLFFDSQMGFLGLWGKKVDAMDHYTAEIEKLSEQVSIFLV